jgi:uncharacterized membrane protein YbhN (UPF0104 family)
MFTIGQWFLIGGIFLVLSLIGLLIWLEFGNWISGIVTIVIVIVLMIALCFGLNWYNTSTASGIRAFKDHQSNLSNGIEREITITAEDGRQIFYYEGKVDVESNHTDNYIKFESEDGKRYIIYYGIQDTITIIEK